MKTGVKKENMTATSGTFLERLEKQGESGQICKEGSQLRGD